MGAEEQIKKLVKSRKEKLYMTFRTTKAANQYLFVINHSKALRITLSAIGVKMANEEMIVKGHNLIITCKNTESCKQLKRAFHEQALMRKTALNFLTKRG